MGNEPKGSSKSRTSSNGSAGSSRKHNLSQVICTTNNRRVPRRKRKRRHRVPRNKQSQQLNQNNKPNQSYDDILGKNLDDASYEELIAKYETIQRKLRQLNNLDVSDNTDLNSRTRNANPISQPRLSQDVDERFRTPRATDERFYQSTHEVNPVDPRFVQPALTLPNAHLNSHLKPYSETVQHTTQSLDGQIENRINNDNQLVDLQLSDDEFLSATSESPRSQINYEQTVSFYQNSNQEKPYSPGESIRVESPTLTISSDSSSVILCYDYNPVEKTSYEIPPDQGPGYDAACCDMEISDLSDIDTDFESATNSLQTVQAIQNNSSNNSPSKQTHHLADDYYDKISPDSPSESEDIQNESPNRKRIKLIPESEDEQGVDEAIMRAQLLISEVSRRLSDEKKEDEKLSVAKVSGFKQPIYSKKPKPEPFIISIGFSSDEEETISTDRTHTRETQLSVVERFLKDAREDCDQTIIRDKANNLSTITERTSSLAHDTERYEIEQKEHSTSQDILLKKKELKIKLIKAGLLRNDANLAEMRLEKIKRREKMLKLKAHAQKLRARYLEAANIARATIQDYKIFEEKLISQEKHTNAERIQLSKLENDCNLLGKTVVGPVYRLPGSEGDRNRNELTSRLKSAKKLLTARLKEMDKHASPNSPAGDQRVRALSDISASILQNQGSDLYHRIKSARMTLRDYIEYTLSPKVSSPFVCFSDKLMYKPIKYVQHLMFPNSENKIIPLSDDMKNVIDTRVVLSSKRKMIERDANHVQTKPYNITRSSDSSLLSSLATSRLELKPLGGSNFISRSHAHNIYPNDFICNADLLGTCHDINCLYQHKSKYLMSNVDKLVDLLSYRPSIAGFRSDPNASQEENYNSCRAKLRQYAKNLLDTNPNKPLELIAENLVKWINCTSNDSDLILMPRQLPKTSQCDSPSLSNQKATLIDENILRRLAGRVEFIPYSEYEYNFGFMIQDDSYRLKHSKISKLSEIDPEMSIKFRFFAEGRPISTELETTLESDQHNVQLWLKLAYHNLVRNPSNKAENVDRSLNVLSRAIEANPEDPELWETYLILYASRVPRPKESNKMDLDNICELALSKCSTMSMYRLYLSLTPSLEKKLTAARTILLKLLGKHETRDTSSRINDLSQNILEVVLFICNLYRHLGQYDKAISIVNNAFSSPLSTNRTNGIIELDIPNVIKQLHPRDLKFARTCCLYMKIYGRLPETRVEPHGFSLPKILSTSPFTIFLCDVDDVKEKLQSILDEDFRDFKIINFDQYRSGQGDFIPRSYKNLLLIYYAQEESESTTREEECFKSYLAARTQMMEGNLKECHDQLYKIYNRYISEDPGGDYESINYIRTQYEKLLCLDNTRGDLYKSDLLKEDSRNRSSIILWLSYILVNKACKTDPKRMNYIYQEGINSCSAAMIDQTLDVTILIYDYIKYLVNNTTDATSFQHVLTTVRHYCVTIAEEDFQIHLIELLLTMVDGDIKTSMSLLSDFCIMLPTNAALINWTIRKALVNDMKDLCLKLVDYLLFEKKSQIVHDEWFWISSLSLIIDSGDHLKAHRIFRLAVGNQPYSVKLWKMMRSYERSINHTKHIELIESTVSQKLHLPLD